jgi:pimeloyl-ACP methyl ester carboxylesterase
MEKQVTVISRRTFAQGLLALAMLASTGNRAMAKNAAQPIDEGMFVPINGVEQWITVRGADRRNPVLLWIHGGPGIAMSGQAPLFFEWERYFTIVQWDQPGGGATAAKNAGDPGELSIERYVRDTIAVAEWSCRHLGTRKLVAMGISWGTLLGLELAHRRPDLVAAYVGTGQIVSGPRGALLGYELALGDARAHGDQAAVTELETVGPPPYATFESFITRQKYVNPPGQKPSAREAEAIASTGKLLATPPPPGAHYVGPKASIEESIQMFLGTQRAMFAETAAWDAEQRVGLRFAMPMFFFHGADDRNTPTALVRDFAERVQAPAKRLVVIPDAGHATIVFHDELLDLLKEHVRPLVVEKARKI